MGILGVILKAVQAQINTAEKREGLKSLLDVQEVAAAKCPPQKVRENHIRRRTNYRRKEKTQSKENHRRRRTKKHRKSGKNIEWKITEEEENGQQKVHPGGQVHCGGSILRMVRVGCGCVLQGGLWSLIGARLLTLELLW